MEQEGKEDPPELRGIIPNTFDYIFRKMDESEGKAFVVQASFLEIYNEEVRDLLAKNHQQKLELKEDPEKGPYVKGLTSFEVKVRNTYVACAEYETLFDLAAFC